jgi:hypothetical protein
MSQYNTYGVRNKGFGDILLSAKHKRAHCRSSLLWYWIYMIILGGLLIRAIVMFTEWNTVSQQARELANTFGEGSIYYDTIMGILAPTDVFMYTQLIIAILSSLLCFLSLITLTELGYKYICFYQYFYLGFILIGHIIEIVLKSNLTGLPVASVFGALLFGIVVDCAVAIALLIWNKKYFEDRETLFDDDVMIVQ